MMMALLEPQKDEVKEELNSKTSKKRKLNVKGGVFGVSLINKSRVWNIRFSSEKIRK